MRREPKTRGLADAIRAKVSEMGMSLEPASLEWTGQRNTFQRWTTGTEPKPENYAVLMEFLGVSLEELGALIVEDQLRKSGLPRP